MRWLLITIPLAIILGFTLACGAPQRPPTLEAQAQEIYRSLMCPLCPGQTLEHSETELSQQMRVVIREKLAQGESKEAIIQFFVDRYGERILVVPKKVGFNLVLWIVPGVAVVVGGYFLFRLIRAMRRRAAAPAPVASPLSDQERQYWEERVREELREEKTP